MLRQDEPKRAPTSGPTSGLRQVASVIDFGDMHETFTVSEVAIAAAYAILGKKEPLRAAAAVVAGYHGAFPLRELEISVLYALIGVRLAVSVVNSAQRATVKPDDSYVTITEAPAWEALARLAQIHPRFAHYTFREACGLQPVPKSGAVRKWLAAHSSTAASLPLDVNLRAGRRAWFLIWEWAARFWAPIPRAAHTETFTRKDFRGVEEGWHQRRGRAIQRATAALRCADFRCGETPYRRAPHRSSGSGSVCCGWERGVRAAGRDRPRGGEQHCGE